MGGAGGRGGSRELLPLTRARLGVEFREPEDPALEAFTVSGFLRVGDGSIRYCFPMTIVIILLDVVSPPASLHRFFFLILCFAF